MNRLPFQFSIISNAFQLWVATRVYSYNPHMHLFVWPDVHFSFFATECVYLWPCVCLSSLSFFLIFLWIFQAVHFFCSIQPARTTIIIVRVSNHPNIQILHKPLLPILVYNLVIIKAMQFVRLLCKCFFCIHGCLFHCQFYVFRLVQLQLPLTKVLYTKSTHTHKYGGHTRASLHNAYE